MAENKTLDMYDILILIFAASTDCNRVIGRTSIQKLAYFVVNVLGIDNDYIHYYYGPFSPLLTNVLRHLVSLNWVSENYSLTENHRGIYTYTLTESGKQYSEGLINNYKESFDKIKKIVDNVKEIKGDMIETLSCAAKIYYIKFKEKNLLDDYNLKQSAKKYGWNLNDDNLLKNSNDWLTIIQD
jgi:uncharacterized protein YwgA